MSTPSDDPPRGDQPRRRESALVALGLLVLSLIAFGGGLRGDFVYDDRKQIVGNHLIQDDTHLVEALTSDVWAFKGERPEPWSNFWRPTFVAWLVICHRFFGLGDPFGWHLASLLLHVVVTWLAWRVARRLDLGPTLALAVAAAFAVHPTRVESVVWVSGVTDPLVAACLLGSLLLLPAARAGTSAGARARMVAAWGLYAGALLAKELAVVWPLVVAVWLWCVGGSAEKTWSSARQRGWGSALGSAPFAGLAAAYLIVRRTVLGRHQVDASDLGVLDWGATVPEVLLFYLRQLALPAGLGPSYPLRITAWREVDLTSWVAACLLVGALAVALAWWARRDARVAVAAALAALPLLPALNLAAFHPEHLVHDRYLYLPLLGAVLLVAFALEPAVRARPRTVAVGAALVVALWTIGSIRTTPVWTDELRLWQRAVAVDPSSASSWAELAQTHQRRGDLGAAARAVDRALALQPVTVGVVTRAQIALARGLAAEAEVDLRRVVTAQPDHALAVELLAMALERQGRLADAEAVLGRGLAAAPHRRCGLLTNRAVVRFLAGERDTATADLEAAVARVDREPTTACRRSLVLLADLERARGRTARADALLERFLELTAAVRDDEVAALRARAERSLGR